MEQRLALSKARPLALQLFLSGINSDLGLQAVLLSVAVDPPGKEFSVPGRPSDLGSARKLCGEIVV